MSHTRKFLISAAACAAASAPMLAQGCYSTANNTAAASGAMQGDRTQEKSHQKNIVGVATEAGSFETLLAACKAAGLVETLSSKGPFTVFAPTDAAFAKLGQKTIAALLADKAKLASILTYHVVPSRLLAKDVLKSRWLSTVQGQSVAISTSDDGAKVDGARIVKTDVLASNGVIHVIDAVILPRKDIVATAVEAGSFETLATALTKAGLVDALRGKGPFTVFAPTDAAFAALPKEDLATLLADKEKLTAVLTYHVVAGRTSAGEIPLAKDGASSLEPATLEGGKLDVRRTKDGVTINGVKVIKADVLAGNGVIHVIDAVLMPR